MSLGSLDRRRVRVVKAASPKKASIEVKKWCHAAAEAESRVVPPPSSR